MTRDILQLIVVIVLLGGWLLYELRKVQLQQRYRADLVEDGWVTRHEDGEAEYASVAREKRMRIFRGFAVAAILLASNFILRALL